MSDYLVKFIVLSIVLLSNVFVVRMWFLQPSVESSECVYHYVIPSSSHGLNSLLNQVAQRSGLKSWYLSSEEIEALDRDPFKLDQNLVKTANIVHGNFTFGFHEKKISSLRGEHLTKCELVTMLRHPVHRVVSELVQNKRPRENWEKCLESGKSSCRKYSNDVVRRLSGDITPDWYTDMHSTPDLVSRTMLEKAKKNLSKFVVIGISERFQDSIKLLQTVFPWANTSELEHVSFANIVPHRPLTPELRQVVEKHNELDIELYHYALTLFEQQLQNNKIRTRGQEEVIYQPPVEPRIPLPLTRTSKRRSFIFRCSLCFGAFLGLIIGVSWVYRRLKDKQKKKLMKYVNFLPPVTPRKLSESNVNSEIMSRKLEGGLC